VSIREQTKGISIRGRIYWLRFQRDGERHCVSLETDDPATALQRAREIKSAPKLAGKSEMERTIDRYLERKRVMNVFSRQTERVAGAALREFAKFIPGLTVEAVRGSHVESHYRKLQARVAETTTQIHMRSIRAFFAWCLRERLTNDNPAAKIQLATIDKPARLKFCTAAERDALISGATTDDLRFILYCGFHCGMRKGEIIEARVGWFDLRATGACHIENTSTFRIKDRDARFIPLTNRFRKFLKTYLAGKDRDAFALRPEVKHGKGTYRYDFHRPYNDYMETSEKKWVTAHVMRHTFASLLVQNGVSVFKVAKWLGDGVEVVERHYAHLAPADRDIEKMG